VSARGEILPDISQMPYASLNVDCWYQLQY